jgi:hypothetical protein
LAPPEFLSAPATHQLVKGYGVPPTLQVQYDQLGDTVAIIGRSGGTTVLDQGLGSIISDNEFRCSASSRDPARSGIVGLHKITVRREDGVIEVSAESTIRATATDFHIIINLSVTRNGQPFFQRQWTATEPRRLL